MQITAESATIGAAALGAVGGLLVEVYKRGVARAVAREQTKQTARDEAAAKQKELSAEQVKADESDKERQSREFWRYVDKLEARVESLEREVRGQRTELDQVRDTEREQRVKITRLTSENAGLRDQVERLKAEAARLTEENAQLHQRLAAVERKTDGDTPTAPAVT